MANSRMNSWPKLCLLLLSGWMLSACDNPPEVGISISELGQTKFDRKLLGQWYWSVNNEIMIITAKDAGDEIISGDAYYLEDYDLDEGVIWLRYRMHTSKIDDQIYGNIQLIGGRTRDLGPISEKLNHIISKLDIGDNRTLKIDILGGRYLDELVANGGLRSHTESDEHYGDYSVLDVTREELIKLIRDHPTDLLFDYADIAVVFRNLEPADQKSE